MTLVDRDTEQLRFPQTRARKGAGRDRIQVSGLCDAGRRWSGGARCVRIHNLVLMKFSSRKDIPLLTGRANPLVRIIRLVAAQARRAPAELVLAEGVRVLEEVTRQGGQLETVLISENFGAVGRERHLLDVWMEREVPLRRCAGPLLRGLSGVVSFQGALALVRVPMLPLSAIGKVHNPLIVFLCGLQDPGNLGTILRSARAAGVSWVGSTAGTVSARNPKAIRASAGSFFSLPVVESLQAHEILDYCRSADIQMYRAAAD